MHRRSLCQIARRYIGGVAQFRDRGLDALQRFLSNVGIAADARGARRCFLIALS
jgi:hypothetical protein